MGKRGDTFKIIRFEDGTYILTRRPLGFLAFTWPLQVEHKLRRMYDQGKVGDTSKSLAHPN